MDFIKQNKLLLGGAVVLFAVVAGYFMFFRSSAPTSVLTASDEVSPISQNLLITLQNLHTIKLDEGIFSDPVFLSLSDFGVTIPSENVGRRNPFEPLRGGTVKSSIDIPAGVR